MDLLLFQLIFVQIYQQSISFCIHVSKLEATLWVYEALWVKLETMRDILQFLYHLMNLLQATSSLPGLSGVIVECIQLYL